MVDAKVFRGQTAILTVETSGGTEVVVGALQDAEIGIEFEDEELMGQSIKIIDRQRVRVGVSVSATHGTWDMAGLKELIGWDSNNSEIEDTPEPPKFNVKGEFESADSNEHFELTVKDVIFNEVTLSWSRDTHVEEDISGEGTDISNINDLTTS